MAETPATTAAAKHWTVGGMTTGRTACGASIADDGLNTTRAEDRVTCPDCRAKMTPGSAAPYVEEATYHVQVTITFDAPVSFAPIERDSPLTSEDALANFYGHGLSEVFDSGEYDYSIGAIGVQKVTTDGT